MLKRICLAAVAAMIMTVFPASAVMAGTMITVSGYGEALIPADTAIISLGVSARDKDVLQAQARVNETVAAIRTALTESGIPKEDINTDYINIYASYNYLEDREELTAYNANSTLAIRTEDMDQVGEIIDLAFEAGANILNGVSFSARDTTQAKEDALKKAVEDARAKADILAAASGLRIRSIESLNEGNTYSFDRGVENNFSMKMEETAAAGDAGTVVQAARLTVASNVTVTYYAESEDGEEIIVPVG